MWNPLPCWLERSYTLYFATYLFNNLITTTLHPLWQCLSQDDGKGKDEGKGKGKDECKGKDEGKDKGNDDGKGKDEGKGNDDGKGNNRKIKGPRCMFCLFKLHQTHDTVTQTFKNGKHRGLRITDLIGRSTDL